MGKPRIIGAPRPVPVKQRPVKRPFGKSHGGRLRFGDADRAPFPSLVAVYRRK